MQALINTLQLFRLSIKPRGENFSHAASIFCASGKERYLKEPQHWLQQL